jgi:hypothetical protein
MATFMGFILGTLMIRLMFLDQTLYKGPNAQETSEKTFKTNDYCYKMIPYIVLSSGIHRHT